MLTEALRFFQGNEFASAMVVSTSLAGVAYLMRSIPAKFWRALLWLGSIEVAVRNSDEEAFEAINKFVTPLCQHRFVRDLVLSTEGQPDYEEDEYRLDIGEGVHFALYRGRPIIVRRFVHAERSMLYKQSEEVCIRFWFRSRAFVQGVIDDIKIAANKHDGIGIRHWTHENWSVPIYKKRRLDSIVLPNGQLESVVEHLQTFVDSRKWYEMRGLPYRIAYLFKGAPGCGKTSLILGLATYFRRPICILSVGALGSDLDLIAAVHSAPKNAIIAIEDIDAATSVTEDRTKKAAETKGGKGSGVTLSGILNALDGIGTPDGRIFIVTTNHPENLDAAFVRAGRIDLEVEFGPLGHADQQKMFALQYGNEVRLPDLGTDMTPARIQQAFLENSTNPYGAIEALRSAPVRRLAA